MLTTREAAKVLGVHPDTIRDWDNRGLLTAVRTPGGHRRFEVSALRSVYGLNANPDVKPIRGISAKGKEDNGRLE